MAAQNQGVCLRLITNRRQMGGGIGCWDATPFLQFATLKQHKADGLANAAPRKPCREEIHAKFLCPNGWSGLWPNNQRGGFSVGHYVPMQLLPKGFWIKSQGGQMRRLKMFISTVVAKNNFERLFSGCAHLP